MSHLSTAAIQLHAAKPYAVANKLDRFNHRVGKDVKLSTYSDLATFVSQRFLLSPPRQPRFPLCREQGHLSKYTSHVIRQLLHTDTSISPDMITQLIRKGTLIHGLRSGSMISTPSFDKRRISVLCVCVCVCPSFPSPNANYFVFCLRGRLQMRKIVSTKLRMGTRCARGGMGIVW